MRKPRFGEVRELAPNRTTGEQLNWERVSGVLPHSLEASAGLAWARRKRDLSLGLILPLGSLHTTRAQNASCKEA